MKSRKVIQAAMLVAILIVVNLLASGFFFRLDLTQEKRYSLSDYSKNTLDSLNRYLSVKVYLEGEFPPRIQRFKQAVKDMLTEMKVYGGTLIQYEFIDPTGNDELMQSFVDKGIAPITLNIRNSQTSEGRQYIFPVAVFSYDGREEMVDLFKGSVDYTSGEPSPLKAEANLEYKLIHAIKRLTQGSKKVVGVLRGHGEIGEEKTREWMRELANLYIPVEVNVQKGEAISPSISVLIVLQPDSAFTEREKYEIDQYLMRGGKILWLLDQQDVNLHYQAETLSRLRQLNLDDLFMKYGFKVNYDLVSDLNCSTIELVIPNPNAPPTFSSQRWIYYPLLTQLADHPITRNLSAVKLRYASSIDTFSTPELRFVPLLVSSPYSRVQSGNVFVDLNQSIRNPPRPEELRGKGNRVMALLAEGQFHSLFEGREVPVDALAQQMPTAKFLRRNVSDTRMIVVGDGQVAVGEDVRGKIDFMAFDNKAFLLNCLDFLLGGESLIHIRAKDIQYHSLDLKKVKGNEWNIRLINLVLPVLVILFWGIIRQRIRMHRNRKISA
jgi:gliding-associated putative ABC transporter substrate-binding component GldG